MLVLSRKIEESIIINGNIEIKVLSIQGENVKLGITAPKEIPVYRKEIYEAILKENKQAASLSTESVRKINKLLKKEG